MKKKRKKKKGELWGLQKEDRLKKAIAWIETYEGEQIVQAYSKNTGLNLKNAMKEMTRLGVKVPLEEKKQVAQLLEKQRLHKERKKEKKRQRKEKEEIEELLTMYDYDETFSFIAGYTSGGAPYGITHEEMDGIENARSLDREEPME